MICYVYKVRKGTYISKKDNKEHHGFNVGLLGLEGSKFALETFLDQKDYSSVFSIKGDFRPDVNFKAGFWDIDIDEFPVYVPQGTQYQKKIISIFQKIEDWEKIKCYLDI